MQNSTGSSYQWGGTIALTRTNPPLVTYDKDLILSIIGI